MKKIMLLIICICLCGCSNGWKNKIQISTLKYEDEYIVGKMKNITDKAYDVVINFKLKSGSLEETERCYETIKPKETINLKCLMYGKDETYSFKIDSIELNEIIIPELKEGNINEETFEYHFEEIYDLHTLSFSSLSIEFDTSKYPYAEEIKYDDNKLEIKTEFNTDSNYSANIHTTYNTETNELESIYGFINYNNDEEFLEKVILNISLMRFFGGYLGEKSSKIRNALQDFDLEVDHCWVVDKWCIMPKKDAYLYSFYISLND